LAYSKCFENLAPISKYYLKRCFKPFVCALEKKGLRKALFFQIAFLLKKGRFMKTYFQSFFERLCKLIKVFGFPKFKKTTSKGTLFSNQNYFKLLPYLAKRNFALERKLLPFCSKNICSKKKCFPKWHLKLLYKILVHENVFNWFFNFASQKPWIMKTK